MKKRQSIICPFPFQAARYSACWAQTALGKVRRSNVFSERSRQTRGAFVCWVKTRRGATVRCFSGSVYSFRRAIISRRLRRRALRRNRLPVPRSGRLACALRAIRHPRQDKRIGQESFRRRASTALYRAGADPAAEAGVFGRADDRP